MALRRLLEEGGYPNLPKLEDLYPPEGFIRVRPKPKLELAVVPDGFRKCAGCGALLVDDPQNYCSTCQ
jgi:hypothetical protein